MIRTPESPRLPAGRASPHAWMVSLADLLALLLTFFVMIFSMNSVQEAEWQAVVSSFRKQFNPHEAQVVPEAESEARAVRRPVPWGSSLDYLAALLAHKTRGPDWPEVRVTRLADRVVLSLPGDLIFERGSASLKAAARAPLESLAEQLGGLANAIEISGHSDPTGSAERNWELSLGRAEAVARALADAGYGTLPVAVGFADGRFGDLDPGLDAATRERFARRVDISVIAFGTEQGR